MSVMLGISSFVIFNDKIVTVAQSQHQVAALQDVFSYTDRHLSLLWLLRDKSQKQLSSEDLVEKLLKNY